MTHNERALLFGAIVVGLLAHVSLAKGHIRLLLVFPTTAFFLLWAIETVEALT